MTSLVKEIDKLSGGGKKAGAFVVLLDKGAAPRLKEIAKKHGIKIPLTVNNDRRVARKFKLSDKAGCTVLLYKKKKVVKTIAAEKLSPAKIKEIAAAAKTVFRS